MRGGKREAGRWTSLWKRLVVKGRASQEVLKGWKNPKEAVRMEKFAYARRQRDGMGRNCNRRDMDD